jgi:NADPH:quinone reductase-like Zn-dependent oxidoreductase
LQRSGDLFNWTASGKLKPVIEKIFSMSKAAHAHRQLEARKTSGKAIFEFLN